MKPADREEGKNMFRLWAKEFKDNRMLRDTTICDDSGESPHAQSICMHWKKYVTCLIWENRSGWNTILMSLNVMQKLVFTSDSFIEQIDFDFLEIQVIEED